MTRDNWICDYRNNTYPNLGICGCIPTSMVGKETRTGHSGGRGEPKKKDLLGKMGPPCLITSLLTCYINKCFLFVEGVGKSRASDSVGHI